MARDGDVSSISTLTDFTTEAENEPDLELTSNSQQFRPQGRTNRSGRTQNDHDVFEGLPIRQWRTAEGHIGPPPTAEPIVNKHAWPELPMPRDSHLLSPMSQQLLRIARAPWLFKSNTNKEDEGKENGDEDEDVKDSAHGFMAKKWTQIPRHLEEPDREFLAKRRKGLPSPFSAEATHTIPAGPSRRTKVRKTDAEGNVTVWEVLVPEGQTVDGEIVEDEGAAEEAIAPVAAAPGTVVEGVGIVNADGVVVASDLVQPTPPRRRPPPPRRKPKKGPGRGKKKVQFTGAEGAAPGANGESGMAAASGTAENIGAQLQAAAGEGEATADGDAEMADAQEGEEDDDEGDEGEEGEEGDDDDDEREEGELSPTPQEAHTGSATSTSADMQKSHREAPQPSEPAQAATAEAQEPSRRDASSSPDLPLATTSHSRSGSKTDIKPQPEQITASEEISRESEQDTRFPEGEIDLFGSLEKHLEKS